MEETVNHKSIHLATYRENRQRAYHKVCGDSPRMEQAPRFSLRVLIALLTAAGLWTYTAGKILGAW